MKGNVSYTERLAVSMLDSGAEGPGFESPGNSLRQTVHTHHASIHKSAKLAAALLRVARVTSGLAESNCSLQPITSPAGWLPRTGSANSFGTLRSVIEYGLFLPFYTCRLTAKNRDGLRNPTLGN